MSVKRLVLRRLEVVGLELVADRENDDIVTQKVQVVAFKRLETHQAIETDVPARNLAILQDLLNVVVCVELILCHAKAFLKFVLNIVFLFSRDLRNVN